MKQQKDKLIEQPRYGCALAAQQTVLAIPRAVPVIHAGPGCSAKVFGFMSYGAGFQGEGYAGGSHVTSTNMTEQDVVFGGEKKLHRDIQGALKVLDADLYVVMSGCTADIVGDDTLSVAREFAAAGHPVVGVESAGFKGNNYFGHEQVLQAIIEQFIGDVQPQVRKGVVNVFSVVPFQDPFWRGDLEELKRILEAIGLTVHILFGNGSEGVSEWRDIPNAEFNLLVSPWTGLKTVKLLQEKYGTPYLHIPILPVGAKETSRFLRKVADFAGIPLRKVETFIAQEEKRFYDYFVSLADFISEYRGNLPTELYLIADSLYGSGVAAFLAEELGFLPQRIYLTDAPPASAQQAIQTELLAKAAEFGGTVVFETDGAVIEQDIRKKVAGSKRALIVGSTWEKYLAEETSNLYLYLSLPLNETVILRRSYLGYLGGLTLIEAVYDALFHRRTTSYRTQLYSA